MILNVVRFNVLKYAETMRRTRKSSHFGTDFSRVAHGKWELPLSYSFFFRETQSLFVDTSFIYLVEVHVRTWRDSHSLVSAFAKYRLRTRRAKRRSRHEQKRTSSTLCLRGMFASSVHWVFAQGHAPTQVIRPPLLSRVRFVRSPVTNES